MNNENHSFNEALTIKLADLRCEPSAATLQLVTEDTCFQMLCKSLLKAEPGTQSQMMIEYLKDVSAMLALVRSVREKSIDLHLAAERALLPKCFAFDHVNYSRYLSAQHVNLQSIKINNPAAWEDLELNGFGGSLTGKPFSTIHGDLITEVTINREVKVRGGPMQGGFSTNERTTDAFIKTSRIIANIRGKLKEKLNVLTSSVHKETTFGLRTENKKAVSNLTKQLESYFNPVLDGPARHMKSGQEIHQSVVDRLLASSSVGETAYLDFVNTRIKAPNNRVSLFEKIPRQNIKTGMEKRNLFQRQ